MIKTSKLSRSSSQARKHLNSLLLQLLFAAEGPVALHALDLTVAGMDQLVPVDMLEKSIQIVGCCRLYRLKAPKRGILAPAKEDYCIAHAGHRLASQ